MSSNPQPLDQMFTGLARFQSTLNAEKIMYIFGSKHYVDKYFGESKSNLLDFFGSLDLRNKQKLIKYFSNIYESLV